MRPSWEALVARSRGLSTHLLPEERVRALQRAADENELLVALRETPYRDFVGADFVGTDFAGAGFVGGARATPVALELAVTRSLAERMTLLAKWAGPDGGALRPLFIEQDARNVRDVLRGIVGALTPEERTASAIPTPSLGSKKLTALARLESPASVADQLVAWGHPFGAALLEEAAASRPDLFRIEAALARRSAEVASSAARQGGKRMKEFVRESIDARNAVTALLLVGARAEGESSDFFVDGGESFSRDDLVRAASAVDRASAAETLAKTCRRAGLSGRRSPLSRALDGAVSRPAALSDCILTERIAAYTKRARQEALSAVPVLLFVLRLQHEARAVRRAIWRTAL
jgi:vacuolar-type H+-ATPase subunit C/Vma6